ncbi:hypothetical protein I8748_13420 [Nostoc sp. CENA67]|uniref:Uncharacterized protein n=1 Tax=Amazonocrinis nigriterrae CENA67 TaxID=2794033 RepID=A0A8J7HNX6_9NOST|nr:hypothetical protein [Amazonocrinis nigriterrae]MBH8563171.1 hypothetical protein [Amazonocrinis nigriterrae CENA67]
MSSGSSGRYQSRLFNFVHQQSRRLTQQWEHTLRHLQVATQRGVEVLFYSVYQLFQSVESSGKRLYTKQSQPKLKLQASDRDFQPETPPNADIPIQRVLESVQNLASEVAIVTPPTTQELGETKDVISSQSPVPLKSWWQKLFHRPTTNASLSQSLTIKDNSADSLTLSKQEDSLKPHLPVVQGIASNLASRNLVLVCTNNEILDILTPQQQTKLQDRIISEVAEYWHSWQLVEAQKETNLLPEINQLLAKLTGVNTANMPALGEGTAKDLLDTGRVLEFLDAVVAKLEANAIIPVQQRGQEIVRFTQHQFSIFIYAKQQLAARGNIAVSDDLETHWLNIQALIAAAINYFFGVSQDKQLEMGKFDRQSQNQLRDRRTMVLPKSSNLQNEILVEDPWLNWDDLFSNSQTIAQIPTSSSNKKSALPSNPSTKLPGKNKLPVQPPKAGSGLVQRKKTSQNITPTQNKSKKVTSANSESCEGEVSQQQFSQNSKVEAKPDWIEIKATSMGYVKHPLEQILEWLDSAMLWVEKIFVNIFHFLQGLLRGKKASQD